MQMTIIIINNKSVTIKIRLIISELQLEEMIVVKLLVTVSTHPILVKITVVVTVYTH
jgi:hypothetical protein